MSFLFNQTSKKAVIMPNEIRRWFFLSLIIMILSFGLSSFSAAQSVQATNPNAGIQTTGGAATTTVSQQQTTDAQIQDQAQDLGNIENLSGGMTSFDPSTIPESVEFPEADFVFEVPVNVWNLDDELNEIYICCQLLTSDERTNLGLAINSAELIDGAFQGNVLVGVYFDPPENPERYSIDQAKKYVCFLRVGNTDQDGDLYWPTTEPAHPIFRRMNPDKRFKYRTDFCSIPEEALLAEP